MKKSIKKANNEVKNIWVFATFIAEIIAPAIMLFVAVKVDGFISSAIALVGSILLVNILAKIYALNRK